MVKRGGVTLKLSKEATAKISKPDADLWYGGKKGRLTHAYNKFGAEVVLAAASRVDPTNPDRLVS